MLLSKEEIKHIAALARIGLEEKEIEKYQKELSVVLEYFKKLEEVDVKKIEPIGHITGVDNVFKEDEVEESDKKTHKQIMDNAPQRKGDYIKVRSVL